MTHDDDLLQSITALLNKQKEEISADTQQAIKTSAKTLRTELGGRIDKVSTDLGGRIDKVSTDLGGRIDTLGARIEASEKNVIGRIDKLKDEILDGMEDDAEIYAHQTDVDTLTQRVTKLEKITKTL